MIAQQQGVRARPEDPGQDEEGHGRPLTGPHRPQTVTPDGLRALLESTEAFTVGVEEEYLLVDLHGPDLRSSAAVLSERAGHDPRVRVELPPCQIEMATPPRRTVREVEDDLRAARAAVATWATGEARPASLAAHPTTARFADDAAGPRAAALVERYGDLARRQVVGALQVHVAVGGADRLIAVHDELRAYLPHLAGLSAASPFGAEGISGLASVRPLLAASLPRQGTPPPLGSCERYAAELRWGAGAGVLPDPTQWWWELRPHVVHGTLEVRVADAQPELATALAVVEVVVALVHWLAERADADDLAPPVPSWRIDENRWSALTHGLEGRFADLDRPCSRPARDEVADLLDRIEPWAERGLDRARRLLEDPVHLRMRALGPAGSVAWAAEVFSPEPPTDREAPAGGRR